MPERTRLEAWTGSEEDVQEKSGTGGAGRGDDPHPRRAAVGMCEAAGLRSGVGQEVSYPGGVALAAEILEAHKAGTTFMTTATARRLRRVFVSFQDYKELSIRLPGVTITSVPSAQSRDLWYAFEHSVEMTLSNKAALNLRVVPTFLTTNDARPSFVFNANSVRKKTAKQCMIVPGVPTLMKFLGKMEWFMAGLCFHPSVMFESATPREGRVHYSTITAKQKRGFGRTSSGWATNIRHIKCGNDTLAVVQCSYQVLIYASSYPEGLGS
ncbi:hypothetical protein B0H19DRAFT_1331777 [Mycena capillaripes]|nr:hypothetical protein B0H19DRAFT_1331777 [Mycena capillaripes]